MSGLIAQNSVSIVLGLGIAFSADWKLTLVILACGPLISLGGYMEMKSFQASEEVAKKALESVSASGGCLLFWRVCVRM